MSFFLPKEELPLLSSYDVAERANEHLQNLQAQRDDLLLKLSRSQVEQNSIRKLLSQLRQQDEEIERMKMEMSALEHRDAMIVKPTDACSGKEARLAETSSAVCFQVSCSCSTNSMCKGVRCSCKAQTKMCDASCKCLEWKCLNKQ